LTEKLYNGEKYPAFFLMVIEITHKFKGILETKDNSQQVPKPIELKNVK